MGISCRVGKKGSGIKMKKRIGFVSNSSSASFIIDNGRFTLKEVVMQMEEWEKEWKNSAEGHGFNYNVHIRLDHKWNEIIEITENDDYDIPEEICDKIIEKYDAELNRE